MSLISRRTFLALSIPTLALQTRSHARPNWPDGNGYPGMWHSEPPSLCPLKLSNSFHGLYFTGRHEEYANADTWYLSWASDDVQYSSFADGYVLNASGAKVHASCGTGFKVGHGYLVILPKAAFYTWQGVSFEGHGVTPDVQIPWSVEATMEGRDNQLEKATEAVNSL